MTPVRQPRSHTANVPAVSVHTDSELKADCFDLWSISDQMRSHRCKLWHSDSQKRKWPSCAAALHVMATGQWQRRHVHTSSSAFLRPTTTVLPWIRTGFHPLFLSAGSLPTQPKSTSQYSEREIRQRKHRNQTRSKRQAGRAKKPPTVKFFMEMRLNCKIGRGEGSEAGGGPAAGLALG